MGKSYRSVDETGYEKLVRCERCGHRIGFASKSGWQILCARCQREDESEWFEEDE